MLMKRFEGPSPNLNFISLPIKENVYIAIPHNTYNMFQCHIQVNQSFFSLNPRFQWLVDKNRWKNNVARHKQPYSYF